LTEKVFDDGLDRDCVVGGSVGVGFVGFGAGAASPLMDLFVSQVGRILPGLAFECRSCLGGTCYGKVNS